MLKALLRWLGFDLDAKPLTVDEDRSGILNFGVPTLEDHKQLEEFVKARRRKGTQEVKPDVVSG